MRTAASKTILTISLQLSIISCLLAPLYPQGLTGQISGTVQDPGGSVVIDGLHRTLRWHLTQVVSYVWQVKHDDRPNLACSAWPPFRKSPIGVCERGGIEWHPEQLSGAWQFAHRVASVCASRP